jgi:hypothetical protein
MEKADKALRRLGFQLPLENAPETAAGDQPDNAVEREYTKLEHQLIESAVDIKQRKPLSSELSFMAKHLVQVTLPHRDPGDVALWTRTNGDLTLVIARTSVDDQGKPVGYPFGTIPRLLLYWITSEAVRTRSRRLELGHNLSEFMREVGLSPETGRGKRGDAVRLKNQMIRLFSASVGFQYTRRLEGVVGQSNLGMLIAPRRQLWWDPNSFNQGTLWQSWIELGEDFFNAITGSAVPVDTRALKAIKNSPLALDLYGWATYKAYQTYKRGQPQVFTYQEFMRQFGTDYSDPKNFKRKLLLALKKVQQIYPALKLEIIEGGLRILPSRPAVPATDKLLDP